MEQGEELAVIGAALGRVVGDIERARGIVRDAMQRLFENFQGLRKHLDEERVRYEQAVDAITGKTSDDGLVSVIRDVLGRFVNDIVLIGQRSVRILMEVEALRGHADQVASRGLRIEKIAQTTRVISLNARIEAQRVGASGAVFRVVADEIKSLANESGELSKAIRDAIAHQASSLAETHKAASELSATDLDVAVESHRRLEDTIAKLSLVSAASSEALDRIQGDIDAAIQALQFEDMVDQLLSAVSGKLTAIRGVCETMSVGQSAGAALRALEREVTRDSVTQHDVSSGSVELF